MLTGLFSIYILFGFFVLNWNNDYIILYYKLNNQKYTKYISNMRKYASLSDSLIYYVLQDKGNRYTPVQEKPDTPKHKERFVFWQACCIFILKLFRAINGKNGKERAKRANNPHIHHMSHFTKIRHKHNTPTHTPYNEHIYSYTE